MTRGRGMIDLMHISLSGWAAVLTFVHHESEDDGNFIQVDYTHFTRATCRIIVLPPSLPPSLLPSPLPSFHLLTSLCSPH